MNTNTPFKLFSNCKTVRGINRSTICDLQRNKIYLIPNSLCDILSDFNGKTIALLYDAFNNESNDIIDEYISFLVEKELIFFTNTPELFPSMSEQWYSPVQIANCIIDFDSESKNETYTIFQSLDRLGCSYLQIRSFCFNDIEFYIKILNNISTTTITSVNLIVPFQNEDNLKQWEQFCETYNRVTSLILYNAPFDKAITSSKSMANITLTRVHIQNEKCCGKIKEYDFISTIESFTESMHHNSCLNRKIAVDRLGNIKNCPSMEKTFGNIGETTLEEVVNKPEFKKNWDINKDLILKCRDCEFRHVCTDCRAYLDDPDNIYSAPLKCGYDPNTCEWEDWSTHPIKQNAIDYYGMREIINPE